MASSQPSQLAQQQLRCRASIEADEVSGFAADRNQMQSQCPQEISTNALARYEVENGRGTRDGTKILMMEWEDEERTRSKEGQCGRWEVRWGRRTRAGLGSGEEREDGGMHRVYFLLGPGIGVPRTVELVWRRKKVVNGSGTGDNGVGEDEDGDNEEDGVIRWYTNPLPAIFPMELGASARQAGKKGVLHTIWAKKRLQALQKEIDLESKANAEGVAVDMAMKEREWIEAHFGVLARPSDNAMAETPIEVPSNGAMSAAPLSPSSPRGLVGGVRLMDKFRGLKIEISDREISGGDEGRVEIAEENDGLAPAVGLSNPLSPELDDMAVSSFPLFNGSQRKPMAQGPPASVQSQQQIAGMSSLNALAGGFGQLESQTDAGGVEDHKEDGLFALPISPRSPEMTKSPFSFMASDTAKYLK